MLHLLHRFCAAVIGPYALVHLANHVAAVGGADRHIAFMEHVRTVTRVPAVEALLLACAAYQVCSGLYFVARRRGERTELFDRLQALSGAYLALFLLIHVSSVMAGRFALGLDTNFYFAAAGLHIRPWPVFFLPYYGLAVVALVVHVACAFHYLARNRVAQAARNRIGYAAIAGGLVLSATILAAFSGAFHEIAIPQAYQNTYK